LYVTRTESSAFCSMRYQKTNVAQVRMECVGRHDNLILNRLIQGFKTESMIRCLPPGLDTNVERGGPSNILDRKPETEAAMWEWVRPFWLLLRLQCRR